jgi:hypothetical protein
VTLLSPGRKGTHCGTFAKRESGAQFISTHHLIKHHRGYESEIVFPPQHGFPVADTADHDGFCSALKNLDKLWPAYAKASRSPTKVRKAGKNQGVVDNTDLHVKVSPRLPL